MTDALVAYMYAEASMLSNLMYQLHCVKL